jgi:hypothetical protein
MSRRRNSSLSFFTTDDAAQSLIKNYDELIKPIRDLMPFIDCIEAQ